MNSNYSDSKLTNRMWRYRYPDFTVLLLHELQKQQQSNFHCDTLLQTEGVCVPAHSCVLSALSPVFSTAFAHSSPLPDGQSRLVRLQAVGACALIKLVGFMYSGEMEGDGLVEKEEVIDAAYMLGLSNLINVKKGGENRHESNVIGWKVAEMQTDRKTKDVGIQVLSERKLVMNLGSQTDQTETYTVTCSVPEVDLPVPDGLNSVPSEHCTISPAIGLGVININAPSSISSSISNGLDCGQPNSCLQSQKVKKKIRDPQITGEFTEESEGQNHISFLNGEEVRAKTFNSGLWEEAKEAAGKELEDDHVFQSSATFEQQESTQISLKVRLKRKDKKALWEIVSVQEENGTDVCAPRSCFVSPGTTQVHTEEGSMLTLSQRNFMPSFQCQNLETVTLTPASDLTVSPLPNLARPSSEQSFHQVLHSIPFSSPLHMPPPEPGYLQAEDSEEQIAGLLEDMAAIGLNILPPDSADKSTDVHKISQLCLQMDPNLGQWKTSTNSPTHCIYMHNHSLEDSVFEICKTFSSASFGQGDAGSVNPGFEDQSRWKTAGSKNMELMASHTSFSISSPYIQTQQDAGLLVTLLSSEANNKSLPIPQQNVGMLKNVLDNTFWSPDSSNNAQSLAQTQDDSNKCLNKSATGRVSTNWTAQCAMQRMNTDLTTNNASATSLAVQQCSSLQSQKKHENISELLNDITDNAQLSTGVVQVPTSDDCSAFKELRLPTCLSPLASEMDEIDFVNQKAHKPLKMSLWRFKPPAQLQSPDPSFLSLTQSFPDKTVQESMHTHLNEKENGLCNSRSRKDYIKKPGMAKSQQVMTQHGSPDSQTLEGTRESKQEKQTGMVTIQKISPKRCSVRDMYESNKKAKMTSCNTNGADVQMVRMPSCNVKKANKEKSGKTFKKITVAKRGPGRPPKTKKCTSHILQNRNAVRKVKGQSTDFVTSICTDDHNLELIHKSNTNKDLMQNEGHDLVREKNFMARCKMSKKSAEYKMQKQESNMFTAFKETIAEVDLTRDEKKQFNMCTRQAKQAQKNNIANQPFHQVIYNVGTSNSGLFLPIYQLPSSYLENAKGYQANKMQTKISSDPEQSFTFKKLMEQVSVWRRNDDSEAKDKDLYSCKNGNLHNELNSNKNLTSICEMENQINSRVCVHPFQTEVIGNGTAKQTENPGMSNKEKYEIQKSDLNLSAEVKSVKAKNDHVEKNLLKTDKPEVSQMKGKETDNVLEFSRSNQQHGSKNSDSKMEVMEERSRAATEYECKRGWTTDETSLSDAALLQRDLPSISSQPGSESQQTELNKPSTNTTGPSPVQYTGVNIESADDRASGEDEEVVVDVDSPRVFPQPLTVRQSIVIPDQDGNDLEEEEEVDVTGDETE